MERQQPFRDLGADLLALVGQRGRQPERLSGALVLVDVDLAPALIGDHEPDQPGSHDEPDHEQPPVELGVHRREV